MSEEMKPAVDLSQVSFEDLVAEQIRRLGLNLSDPGLVTVSRNDVRDGKPRPEPYLRAAWLLRAYSKDCLVVEDSVTGAQSGLAAGMHVMFWPESDAVTPQGAERMVDLAHLAAVIREKRQT